jgi:hypothetical protein
VQIGLLFPDHRLPPQTHPDMGGETVGIASDSIMQLRRAPSPPKHPVRRQALLEADGFPRHAARRPVDRKRDGRRIESGWAVAANPGASDDPTEGPEAHSQARKGERRAGFGE